LLLYGVNAIPFGTIRGEIAVFLEDRPVLEEADGERNAQHYGGNHDDSYNGVRHCLTHSPSAPYENQPDYYCGKKDADRLKAGHIVRGNQASGQPDEGCQSQNDADYLEKRCHTSRFQV
jgi:hypothetical protein